MIKVYKFPKAKNIQSILSHIDGYAIDSELEGVYYVFVDDELAIVKSTGGIRCERADIPRLLPMLCDAVRYELSMIIKDIGEIEKVKGCQIWTS